MKTLVSSSDDIRSKSRKIFCKKALVIYHNQAPVIIRATDISYFDIYVISPTHVRRKTVCWLKLTIPINPEENQIFDVKARVISSVYNSKKNGFIQGLEFLKVEKEMIQLISRL